MATLETVVLRIERVWAMELDISGEQSTMDVYSVKTPVYFDWELNEK